VKRLLLAAFLLTMLTPTFADLTFPAIFKVVEEKPDQFVLTVSVPLVKGRYIKVQPIVPEGFRPADNPEMRAGAASLTRSWEIQADRTSLHNTLFGLEGLQGTPTEVRFLLTTLDGRRIETVLRSTRPIILIPEPENIGQLAARTWRDGLRRAARSSGLWLLLASLIFPGRRFRLRLCGTGMLGALFIGTWAMTMNLPRAEWSDAEFRIAACFYLLGGLTGVAGVAAAFELIRSFMREKVRSISWKLVCIPASAWIFYQGAGLIYHHGPAAAEWSGHRLELLAHHWFSPFAADWAMARLRIPMLSMLALVCFLITIIRIKHLKLKLTASVGLLLLVFILLPYGIARAAIPFRTPEAPSAKQAHRIIEPMLREIYHALNLQDENQTYDKLAEQVAGELVTDLYLDSRRRLISGTQEGVSVQVKQVQLESIEEINSTGAGSSGYRCCWSVIAKVTHWQHTHERRNLYKGDLSLAVEEDRWKLSGLDLRSEEREVVPGSFRSR
jgi:hypothetical protein